MTTVDKRIPTHIEINPPEGGLRRRSFIKSEDIRSISKERLRNRLGRVIERTLRQVEEVLLILLDIRL